MSTANSFVTLSQNYTTPSQLYRPPLEMFRFITTMKTCAKLPKIFTTASTHEIMILRQFFDFKNFLVLVELLNDSTKCSWSWFVSKIFKIYFCFRYTSSHWTPYHEYYFSIYYIPLFKTLPIQSSKNSITEKYREIHRRLTWSSMYCVCIPEKVWRANSIFFKKNFACAQS